MHTTVLAGKQFMFFFQHKPLQNLAQVCLDARSECKSLSPALCCYILLDPEPCSGDEMLEARGISVLEGGGAFS